MSLFDVIKYPISNRPKLEELEAIPDDILQEWLRQIDYRGGNVKFLLRSMSLFYSPGLDGSRITILKEIIKEHNELV